jgi:predicted nucleotidyltransferase
VLSLQGIEQGSGEHEALNDEYATVKAVLAAEIPDARPEVVVGGSLAKGTIIRSSYDLDVVAYLDNDDTGAGDTLSEIYDAFVKALGTAYKAEPKRSAIRLTERADGTVLPFGVDVVPGRFTNEQRDDVFLFQAEGEKNRLQTNLRKHVSHVQDSGHADVIRLAKLWKLRAGLEVKTFVLELVVLAALENSQETTLSGRLVHVWTRLRDDIDGLTVEDPANPTGNDLSSIYGDAEQMALMGAATVALDLVEQGDWPEVFGIDIGNPEEVPEPTQLVRLDDVSHRLAPPWLRSGDGVVRVVVSAAVESRRGGLVAVSSGKTIFVDDRWLRFRASTPLNGPFEVRWQVVNTGNHARSEGGLRGRDFFTSVGRGRFRPASKDPMETWERTLYTGAHTIQCFLVRDDRIVGQSEPFVVNIINTKRRGYRPPRSARRRR